MSCFNILSVLIFMRINKHRIIIFKIHRQFYVMIILCLWNRYKSSTNRSQIFGCFMTFSIPYIIYGPVNMKTISKTNFQMNTDYLQNIFLLVQPEHNYTKSLLTIQESTSSHYFVFRYTTNKIFILSILKLSEMRRVHLYSLYWYADSSKSML